jgi:hypothetical protein
MVDGDVNGWNVYGQLQDFVFMSNYLQTELN